MTRVDPKLEHFESGIILAVDRLADINKRLTKQIATGRCDSEVVGAIADMRELANRIERFNTAFNS